MLLKKKRFLRILLTIPKFLLILIEKNCDEESHDEENSDEKKFNEENSNEKNFDEENYKTYCTY